MTIYDGSTTSSLELSLLMIGDILMKLKMHYSCLFVVQIGEIKDNFLNKFSTDCFK